MQNGVMLMSKLNPKTLREQIDNEIETVAKEICDEYCKWPLLWDEEAEGEPLEESHICKNCPFTRL